MKSFNEFFDNHKFVEFLYQMYKHRVLTYRRNEDGGIELYYENFTKLAKSHQEEFAVRFQLGKSQLVSLHALTKVIGQGPKILTLENLDYQAMAHINLSLTIEEYTQPFNAMVIEFPKKFEKEYTTLDPVSEVQHYPVFGVVLNEPGIGLFVSIMLSSSDVYSFMMEKHDETIEQQLIMSEGKRYKLSLPITDDEEHKFVDVIKVCLNTCLFVDGYGIETHGNSQRTRYEHFLSRAKKTKDQIQISKAERDLRLLPCYYGFRQKLRYKEREVHEQKHGEPTGRRVRPHWRASHDRDQAYGPGHSLRKKIRIPPVLVNEEFFIGDFKDTYYQKSV